nr:MAG TPA: hypothetical protein [Bacteriophage sp.]
MRYSCRYSVVYIIILYLVVAVNKYSLFCIFFRFRDS